MSNTAPAACMVMRSPYCPTEFANTTVSGCLLVFGIMTSDLSKSFQTQRKSKIANDPIADKDKGKIILEYVVHFEHPSISAASTKSFGRESMKDPTKKTPNGIMLATWLNQIPGYVLCKFNVFRMIRLGSNVISAGIIIRAQIKEKSFFPCLSLPKINPKAVIEQTIIAKKTEGIAINALFFNAIKNFESETIVLKLLRVTTFSDKTFYHPEPTALVYGLNELTMTPNRGSIQITAQAINRI